MFTEESDEKARLLVHQLTELQMQDADSLLKFWETELKEAGVGQV